MFANLKAEIIGNSDLSVFDEDCFELGRRSGEYRLSSFVSLQDANIKVGNAFLFEQPPYLIEQAKPHLAARAFDDFLGGDTRRNFVRDGMHGAARQCRSRESRDEVLWPGPWSS